MTHPLLPQLLNGLGRPLGVPTFVGDGTFACDYATTFKAYVCTPKTPLARATAISLQKATDAMLDKLPLFVTWKDPDTGKPVKVPTNPIGSSKAGYDGVIGPFTVRMVQLAMLGAIELRNQGGELAQVADGFLSVAKETDEAFSAQKIANNTAPLSVFLQDATTRFNDLNAIAKAKAAAHSSEPPIVLQPLPVSRTEGLTVSIPPVVMAQVKKAKKSRAWLWWTLGIVAVAGTGTAIYVHQHKKKRELKKHGARGEHTQRYRRPYYAGARHAE